MISLNEFKNYVDNANKTICQVKNNPSDLMQYLDIKTGYNNENSVGVAQDYLNDKIKNFLLIKRNERSLRLDLKVLKKVLIIDSVINKNSLQPYFNTLCALFNCCENDDVTIENVNWIELVQASFDYSSLLDSNFHESSYFREYAIAHAIQRLIDKGYRVKINYKSGLIDIPDEVQNDLLRKIKKIGGLQVISSVRDNIYQHYNKEIKRYLIGRNVNTLPTISEPQVPFNLLLQLSVKVPYSKFSDGYLDAVYSFQILEILELARDFTALIDVQPYNIYELMFKEGRFILDFLKEVAVYDLLFTLNQNRPRDVFKIIEGVTDWVHNEKIYADRLMFGAVKSIAKHYLNILDKYKEPDTIHFKKEQIISSGKKASVENALDIVQNVFSHNYPGANQGFSKIKHNAILDFNTHPFLINKDGHFCIIDPSISAPNFLESVLKYLRTNERNADSKVGLAFERFVLKELTNSGVKVLSGKYNFNKNQCDCDVIVEAESYIVFFELKKKALTQRSKLGNSLNILIDLCASLVKSQYQAGKHELLLYKFGKIPIKKTDGSVYDLNLNGREVMRVSLSLTDYGAFQSRLLFNSFLESCLKTNFVSLHKKFEPQITSINGDINKLRSQITEISQFQEDDYPPFYNSWFISAYQLLDFLSDVNCNESLVRSLLRTRNTVTGSLDIYRDYQFLRRLN